MKKYLLTAGPTPVPDRILLAMAREMIHHRHPEFKAIFKECQDGMRWLYQTKSTPLFFCCSGSGAMEGAVVNFLSPGDEAIVVVGGKFGERWVELCKAYGITAHEIAVEWGHAVDPAAVARALEAHPAAKAVYVQASETSTGAAHPIQELAALTAARPDTLLVVDAITALGVWDVPVDAWGLDVVVCGSQKALMLPPGLAFASVSDKAWRLAERARTARFYFDWRRERKKQETADVAFTPAVSLFVGLREALAMMKEEGLPGIFARHDLLARATRAGAQAIGLSLFATAPSASVTAVNAPAGVDSQKIVSTMRDKYGVAIAGGQDQAKGKIIRLAHLGYFDRFDIVTALSALELALGDLGHAVELGASVAAAEKVFAAAGKAK